MVGNRFADIGIGVPKGMPKGKMAIKIFTQLEQPIAENVGDIWVKTDKSVESVFFREFNNYPSGTNSIGVVTIGSNSEIKTKIDEGIQFIGRNETEMIVKFPSLEILNIPSEDMIKIWENAYMQIYTRIGNFKYWNNTTGEWVFEIAHYWNGTNWVKFSGGDFNSYVTVGYSLYKIDPESNVLWNIPLGAAGVRALAIYNNYVYVGAHSSYLKKYDSKGNLMWTSTEQFTSLYRLAVDGDGYIYAGLYGTKTKLVKINPNDGTKVWEYTNYVGSGIDGMGIDKNGYIYTGDYDGYIKKITSDGELVWSKRIHSTTNDFIYAFDVHPDGYCLSGTDDNIKCIDTDGNVLWTATPGRVRALAVDFNYVYFVTYTSGTNYLYKYNLISGSEISKTTRSGYVRAIGITPDNCVYVGDESGNLQRFNNGDTLTWQITPSSGSIGAIKCEPSAIGSSPEKW